MSGTEKLDNLIELACDQLEVSMRSAHSMGKRHGEDGSPLEWKPIKTRPDDLEPICVAIDSNMSVDYLQLFLRHKTPSKARYWVEAPTVDADYWIDWRENPPRDDLIPKWVKEFDDDISLKDRFSENTWGQIVGYVPLPALPRT